MFQCIVSRKKSYMYNVYKRGLGRSENSILSISTKHLKTFSKIPDTVPNISAQTFLKHFHLGCPNITSDRPLEYKLFLRQS